ncbi:MAG: glutamate racemase [Wujia sp.]
MEYVNDVGIYTGESEVRIMELKEYTDRSDAPIAVFDSGVGGISVLRALVHEMPHEDYWYFGDSAHAPYGTKKLEEVRALTFSHVEHFIEYGAKAVVVACNTATSAAVRLLRERYPDFTIVGIEPALKPAVYAREHPNVVVMATPMTLREEKFHNLMDRYTDLAHIVPLPCPGLMEYIEQGNTDSEELDTFLRRLFAPFAPERIDSVVLGCTHYPFVSRELQKILGPDIQLFDGGPGTARETKRRLAVKNLLTRRETQGNIIFENSDPSEDKILLCRRLLQMPS